MLFIVWMPFDFWGSFEYGNFFILVGQFRDSVIKNFIFINIINILVICVIKYLASLPSGPIDLDERSSYNNNNTIDYSDVTSRTERNMGGSMTTISGTHLGAIWGFGNEPEESEKNASRQRELHEKRLRR